MYSAHNTGIHCRNNSHHNKIHSTLYNNTVYINEFSSLDFLCNQVFNYFLYHNDVNLLEIVVFCRQKINMLFYYFNALTYEKSCIRFRVINSLHFFRNVFKFDVWLSIPVHSILPVHLSTFGQLIFIINPKMNCQRAATRAYQTHLAYYFMVL